MTNRIKDEEDSVILTAFSACQLVFIEKPAVLMRQHEGRPGRVRLIVVLFPSELVWVLSKLMVESRCVLITYFHQLLHSAAHSQYYGKHFFCTCEPPAIYSLLDNGKDLQLKLHTQFLCNLVCTCNQFWSLF